MRQGSSQGYRYPRRGWRGLRQLRVVSGRALANRSKSTADNNNNNKSPANRVDNSVQGDIRPRHQSNRHNTSLFFSFSGYTFLRHSFTAHLPTLANPSLVFYLVAPSVRRPKLPLASNQLSDFDYLQTPLDETKIDHRMYIKWPLCPQSY